MDPVHALEHLVGVVQKLSLARSLDDVTGVVRHEARVLTGADGATFVMRDGDHCSYVDEEAIEPLWKGRRFPMDACVSGWSMIHGEAAVIPDIYADPRIPVDAYRPTFVRSLVMMPIRTIAPIGAIGVYWRNSYTATARDVQLLRALADSTAVALENVRVYQELDARVTARTTELWQTVEQLQRALGEITTLRGLIAICAHCKDIRDKQGDWHKIEHYLTAHTLAQFSHGICPECFRHYDLEDDPVQ